MRGSLASGIAAVAAALVALAGCGDQDRAPASGGPSVVVTHAVLGAIVSDAVGGVTRVDVLMPNGADPHAYRPSAKDVEALQSADLVVANGLGLEEGLEDALDRVREDGRLFEATDHLDVRPVGWTDGDPAEQADSLDPHFWTDPARARSMVVALGRVMERDLGIAARTRAGRAAERLAKLDAQIGRILDPIPAARRKLVTGHDSMGYFARRYGFDLVGTVVPGLSSQGGVAARGLAALAADIAREDVDVVFTEDGTPNAVAQAVVDQSGARLVELPVAELPADGSYATFMRGIATTIARELRS